MYITEEKKRILDLALRRLEHLSGDVEEDAVSTEAIQALREEIEAAPAGYVVLNLSIPVESGGRHDFFVLGDEATSYGNIEHAASQVEERMRENGHTWDTVGVFALYPVPIALLEPLVEDARREALT